MSKSSKTPWRKILSWVTLLALVLLVVLLRKQIGQTFSNLGRVHAWILLFMILWQAWNYHAYTQLYRGLFAILGHKVEYWPMYRIAVELNFVNHVFPTGGVSGFSYFSVRLKEFGITAAKSTLVQMMRFVTVFISFEAILLVGVFMLAVNGKAGNLTILVASSIGTFLVFCTMIGAYIVESRSRIDTLFTTLTRVINKAIHVVRPRYPETINIAKVQKLFLELHQNYHVLKENYKALKRPLTHAFFANLTEILTLYTVYVAFGERVNFGAVILGYAVANFAGLISVLPGGIGIYEALMTGVMALAGIPPSESIPVTVMYRVLSMALQLPPGYYLYQKAINGKQLIHDR
jgi:uncharacterized protein (TIRG00374 family)